MSRFLLPTVISFGAALALGAPSLADSYDVYGANERVVVKVKINDGDLRSPDGAKALALRIRVAAAKACGGDVDPTFRNSDNFMKCRENSIDRAIKGLNSPLLADALGRSPQRLARAR